MLLGRKAMTNLDSILKSRHYFADRGLYSQSYGFSTSRVWIWELDNKENWVPRPMDSKEIKPVNSKGNQSWIFIRRTDAEAPILWPHDVKSQLGKDPDAGKDWGQEEKRAIEDETVSNTNSMNISLSKLQEIVKDRNSGILQSMGSQRFRHDWATEQKLWKTAWGFLKN